MMIRVGWVFVLASLVLNVGAEAQTPRMPDTPRVDSADTYFGTRVADPYRWLEHYDTPSVRAWYEEEDAVARAALDATPHHARYLVRLREEVSNRHEFPSLIAEQPGRTFYLKRLPGEPSPSLYLRDAYDGRERALVTPGMLDRSASGSAAIIVDYDPSPSGAHAVVIFTVGGNERPNAVIVATATGHLLPDELPPHANAVAWLPDGRALFYRTARDVPPDATSDRKWGGLPVRRHVLGTATASDDVVIDPVAITGDSSWRASVTVQSEGMVALATLVRSSQPRQYTILARRADSGAWRPIASPADSITGVRVRGPWLYGISHRGTTIGRLVRVPVPAGLLALDGQSSEGYRVPGWAAAEVLLDSPDVVFFNAQQPPVFARDGVYWLAAGQGRHRLFRYGFDTGVREEIELPFEGSAAFLSSLDPLPGVRFIFGGWTQGDRHYRYDPATRGVVELPPMFNPPNVFDHLDGLSVKTVEIPSHDGVQVPLTILQLGGLDGPRPTILAGYGAYGYTNDAYFRSDARPWLESGGIYAICHTRGGGYHGEPWHVAGMQATKANTWKDAIACAEYLVKSRLTTPVMLGLNGGSAGGILAGRAVTERPDLFGAVVIEAGLADLVRFGRTNAGPGNTHEFGSPDTEAGFRSLLAMSPYHHVSSGVRYPAMLFYAPFNDARVAPWHSAKFAAALRSAGGAAAGPGGARPVLLRVDFGAGHGADSGMDGLLQRAAIVYGFFAQRLGLVIR